MGGQLLVAGGYAAKPLQAVDAALDDVPPTIVFLVEALGRTLFVRLIGNHWGDVMVLKPFANPVSRVALVAGDFGWLLRPRGRLLHERNKTLSFVLLSRTNGHGQRCARCITDEMQLRAEPALTASQGMI